MKAPLVYDVGAYLPLDAHDENEFGLARDVIGAILLAQSCETDLLTLCIAVLLDVRLSTLEDNASFLLCSLL